jgi:hypothetical protein
MCSIRRRNQKIYSNFATNVHIYKYLHSVSIACIIPSVISIIHANLDRMVLKDENQGEFRDKLIYFIKNKF